MNLIAIQTKYGQIKAVSFTIVNKTIVRKKLYGNVFNTYSTHKEEKSITTEIFIKTFKNKIYKYMI